MPLKNYNYFIKLMKKFPEVKFVTIGQNYPLLISENHIIISGQID